MSGQTIVVTGGAGVLGRSVVRRLADTGHDVLSVDLPGAPCPEGAREAVEADLTDVDQASATLRRARPDAVVHLAAIAVPFSRPEPDLLRTNLTLAHNVCEAALATGARTVVLAGSLTVLGYGRDGWRPDYLPLDEAHPPRPWHAYALSKLATEHLVQMYALRGERTRFSLFRPGYVISPEQWRGAPTQDGSTVRERLDDPAIAAKSLFNYVDARDAADLVALQLAADDLPSGEVFIACAADAMARTPIAELLPRFHPGVAGLDVGASAFAIAKAERLLGWRPTRSWRTELADPGGPR